VTKPKDPRSTSAVPMTTEEGEPILAGVEHPSVPEAAALIARWNDGRSADDILFRLVASYRMGELELFVLRRPPDTLSDKYGHVYAETADADAPDHEELVLERQKEPWPRETFAQALKFLHQRGSSSGLGPDWFAAYRSRERLLFREFAAMGPRAYDPGHVYLGSRHVAAAALTCWCAKQRLAVPPAWRHERGRDLASGKGASSANSPGPKPGRRPRGLQAADAPLVERALEMMAIDPALSAHRAVQLFAEQELPSRGGNKASRRRRVYDRLMEELKRRAEQDGR
jgi:hypothetical protein